ncbi:MAG: hypothetical protein ACN6N7_09670 [Chryseobacterium culicis]
MKKLRITIDRCIEKAELQWKALPKKRQIFLTKMFFMGYVLLTLLTILQIWLKDSGEVNVFPTGHISTLAKQKNIQKEPVKSGINPQNKNSYERSE